MLILFALVPTVAVALVGVGTASRALSMLSARSAWERIALSGEQALSATRSAPLTVEQRAAVERHEAELRQSVELARRFDFVAGRSMRLVVTGAVLVVLLVAVGASRVAGHLSRQLSRPLDELVGWTGLIRTGRPIPGQPERRGAPEFEVLRTGMRTMAQELETGRRRALEAERAEAFRESARRFAHELKNPLTPIRFAVDRLRRSAPEELRDTVEVLAEEAARLETMAKSFAQFGRLPDGPAADIDVSELVTRVARSTVPERLAVAIAADDALPLVHGFHEPLVRAVTNVLMNAVDACGASGQIDIALRYAAPHVTITIRDSGCGIAPDALARIFDPYVTTKPGGTGLGLAIARQTMEAHQGFIDATSALGQGTEIILRLPIRETTA
ncbi:HAMP domain-containing sensor histidine kinase [Gemmatimonas sp.]|uniref:sensor histidine kinase n=1 Tax=Gemmatimonas sp. TaxID=1962908 RepID=UPI00286D9FC5|nr:HAMP domain-containing sensor histidine kinase [Gemmatimonas sp.]